MVQRPGAAWLKSTPPHLAEAIAGEKLIVTAGGLDTHIHFICPQLADEAIASVRHRADPRWRGGGSRTVQPTCAADTGQCALRWCSGGCGWAGADDHARGRYWAGVWHHRHHLYPVPGPRP